MAWFQRSSGHLFRSPPFMNHAVSTLSALIWMFRPVLIHSCAKLTECADYTDGIVRLRSEELSMNVGHLH